MTNGTPEQPKQRGLLKSLGARLPGIGKVVEERDRLRAEGRRLRRDRRTLQAKIGQLQEELAATRLSRLEGPAGPTCAACGYDVAEFLPGPNGRPNARCPRCQALERHRMLLWLMRRHEYLFQPPARVLDVAPSQSVRNYLWPRLRDDYVSIDLMMEKVSARADLTRLCFAPDTFDVIVCYHVLEHIPDDASAIAELARVLKPGGLAFIQVPRNPDEMTAEDPSAPVEERIRRFGQDDHVRFYGKDLENRLAAGGLIPRTEKPAAALSEEERARYGLRADEEVWICRVRDGDPAR